jgi:capsular exopolysaccharide synthesis family protein
MNHQPANSRTARLPAIPGTRQPWPARNYAAAEDASENNGLLDLWRVIWLRKGTVLLFTFAVGIAGMLLTIPETPVFQATTTLEIQPINEDFLQMRDVNPNGAGPNAYYPEYDIQTQLRIIESRSLMDRVVDKMNAGGRPLVEPESWSAVLSRILPASPREKISPRKAVLRGVAASVKVRAKPNTRLLEVSCDSTDPQLATDFLNTLTSEYIEASLEARWQATQHTGEWLARQMDDVRVKLEKSDGELQAYARSAGLLFTDEKDNVAEQRLRQLQEELSRAQADRITRQSKYELASKAAPESLGDVLDDAGLRDYSSKLTELKRQQAELGSTFTDEYPKVKRLQGQVATLQAAVEKSRSDILHRINNDYQAALRREKLLSAEYSSQASLVSEQTGKVAHYNLLKHEVDTNRQLYEHMLQRVKEAGVASALRASNIRVVDAATLPESPYKPSVPANTAMGLVMGMFLGTGVAVTRARADRRLQDPEDVQRVTQAPSLGVIPSGRFSRRVSFGRSGAGCAELVSLQEKQSLMSESFRAASVSILFSKPSPELPRVLVFTSPQPKEGKTTTVSNIGISLAQVNWRVLMLDGDLRRPRLPEIFSTPNETGLCDLLAGEGAINGRDIDSAIHATQVEGLWLLPSGRSSAISTSLLSSPRLGQLIDHVRQSYDMVLIDTPPMLHIPDARVFGELADAVVLVMRAGQTTGDAAQSSMERLAADAIPVLGTVLNDWDPRRSSRYGYYRDYGRHYRDYYSRAE